MEKGRIRAYFINVFYIPLKDQGDDAWQHWRPTDSEMLRLLEQWAEPEFKRKRCWGFYLDYATAEKVVMENWADIFENGYYNIALIEGIPEGICFGIPEEFWFAANPIFDSKRYVAGYNVAKIERPKRFHKSVIGYSF
jgi:hypothetical protein